MAKGSAIKLRGKELSIEGVLNLVDMTLEIEEFTEPIELKKALELANLDGVFVKVKFTEGDTPLTEEELS